MCRIRIYAVDRKYFVPDRFDELFWSLKINFVLKIEVDPKILEKVILSENELNSVREFAINSLSIPLSALVII